MSLILVSNTADHSAAEQIRAHEQILHNFRGWCVNKHSILPFVVSSVILHVDGTMPSWTILLGEVRQ